MLAACHPQMGGLGLAHGDDLAVEGLTDPGDHLETEVLVSLLYPIDGTLACTELVCELVLGPAVVES